MKKLLYPSSQNVTRFRFKVGYSFKNCLDSVDIPLQGRVRHQAINADFTPFLARERKFPFEYAVYYFNPAKRPRRVCLFGFYGIANFEVYLKPNPFFIQINSSISNNSV